MSYILEALKKSEKERKKEGVPDLQADHSLPPVRRTERNPLGKLLIGVGGGLLLTGGGWFWWQGQHKDLSQPLPEKQISSPPSISVSPEISQVPVSSDSAPDSAVLSQEILAKISKEVLQAVTEAKAKNSSVAVAAVVADTEPAPSQERVEEIVPEDLPPVPDNPETVLPSLEELPVELRQKIPKLSFAGHVYADEAEKRLIIINNRIVREGDLVSKGLSLQQITRDGVIIRYETFVFQVKLF